MGPLANLLQMNVIPPWLIVVASLWLALLPAAGPWTWRYVASTAALFLLVSIPLERHHFELTAKPGYDDSPGDALILVYICLVNALFAGGLGVRSIVETALLLRGQRAGKEHGPSPAP